MKIYVITEGDYSDYHICAVTEDKEKAYHLKELFSGRYSYAEIEEWDTEEFSFIKKDEKLYEVTKINEKLDVCQLSIELNDLRDERVTNVDIFAKGGKGLMTRVLAKDEAHALKIAADRFAKHEAEKSGI